MGFQLTIAEGKESGREFVFEQSSVLIGRTSECDVVLYEPGVSRKHCRIFMEGDGYFVEDMGSSNGTKVNGSTVQKTKLKDGDAVTLGPVVFNFSATELIPEVPTDAGQGEGEGSTRIVSADQLKRQRNKGSALAPEGAKEEQLKQLSRSTTKSMMAVTRPKTGTQNPAALAKKPPEEIAEMDTGAKLERPRPVPKEVARGSNPGGLSAADRARMRREAQESLGGKFRLFWAEASSATRLAVIVGAVMLGVGAIGGGGYAVLASADQVDLGPEPDVLRRKAIAESFGLGEDVTFRRADMKIFSFEFATPTRAVIVLRYQAKDVSQGEVTVSVNGQEVGQIPPDTLDVMERLNEIVIAPRFLKKGEKNELIFDSTLNPPQSDPWKIWNLSIETIVLPNLQPEEMLSEAKASFERGQRNFEQRMVGAPNRYEAWKEYRNAWLLLEDYPDPKPVLHQLSLDQMRAAQRELDDLCKKLMLEVQSYANQNRWEDARLTLDHVKDYFPANDQACPFKADRKRAELDL